MSLTTLFYYDNTLLSYTMYDLDTCYSHLLWPHYIILCDLGTCFDIWSGLETYYSYLVWPR